MIVARLFAFIFGMATVAIVVSWLAPSAQVNDSKISPADYSAINLGMSRDAVANILGNPFDRLPYRQIEPDGLFVFTVLVRTAKHIMLVRLHRGSKSPFRFVFCSRMVK